MTAVVAGSTASSGETDFFSDKASPREKVGSSKEQKNEEKTQKGVFGLLFRRKKNEPTIANGAADLLDDEIPSGSDGVGDSAVVVTDNDEEEDSSEEEEESESQGDEEGVEWQTDEDEHDEDSDVEQESQDDFGAFGDFKHAPQYDESNEDGDEMMSLMGGPRQSGAQKIQEGLGASLGKFLGFIPREDEKQKERQSLLHDNDESDEDDYQREKGPGLLRSSNSDNFDSQEDSESDGDDSDLGSEQGEYRLESFYPSDSCRQEFPGEPSQDNRQDLHGRIRGFGSQSALAYNHNSMDTSSSSRFFVDVMSDQCMASMNTDSADEKRGILGGVGQAVSNITELIRQKRTAASAHDERRRMLSYISELENKLVQKERELQTWKERAEQLQLEVNCLHESENGGEEESESGEKKDEFEGGDDEVKERALIAFEGNVDSTTNSDEGGDGAQEGTLIDMSPKKEVFDPLEKVDEDANLEEVNDDLMSTSHYQQLTNDGSNKLQEASTGGTSVLEKNENPTDRTSKEGENMP